MAQIEQVTFSQRRVRDGEIDIPQLSLGYLAALAAATGRPLITAAPVKQTKTDWSDYDYPKEEEFYHWGDESYGLRAFVSGQLVHHGRRGGSQTFWVFFGVPEGLSLRGEGKLHNRWHSYARLMLDGKDAAKVASAFRKALAPYDVLHEPDGVAVAALEETLTLLCWYGKPLEAALAPPLVEAARAVPADRPAGAAVRYLLSCVHQATGQIDEAAELLEALRTQGATLRFSHGINCGRAEDGSPGQVAWQDEFPPPLPFHEVLLSLGWAAERQGDKARARKHYGAVARDDKGVAGDQARQQLKRLGEK